MVYLFSCIIKLGIEDNNSKIFIEQFSETTFYLVICIHDKTIMDSVSDVCQSVQWDLR